MTDFLNILAMFGALILFMLMKAVAEVFGLRAELKCQRLEREHTAKLLAKRRKQDLSKCKECGCDLDASGECSCHFCSSGAYKGDA